MDERTSARKLVHIFAERFSQYAVQYAVCTTKSAVDYRDGDSFAHMH